MTDKKALPSASVPTQQEADETYRQMMDFPHDLEVERRLMNYKREQWVRDQMQGIAPSQLPHHNHYWTSQTGGVAVDASYVDKLERELRSAKARIEQLEEPQVGPDLLTPMRQMAAKFDLLEKALEEALHTPNAMWNELFSRQGRFFVYEHALREYPRLMLSAMCGMFPLRTEYVYERGAFDITGVSLYFKPIGPHDQIPRYELEFANVDSDPATLGFRWTT